VRAIRRIAVAALLAAAVVVAWLGLVWPPPSWWRDHWPAETSFMAWRAAELRTAHAWTPRRYQPVPARAISPWLRRAAVASEDDAFYQHHGIDYRSLREALGYRRPFFAWSNPADRAELWRALRHAWAHRSELRGASTITQQLARNLYLTPSRSLLRKLKEAVLAYRLEWALSKSRILELYLNVAEFGPNLWGVAAASHRYFGEPPGQLPLAQAALLIATLPHPLTSTPAFRPGRTRWRQQLILLKLGGAPVVIPPEEGEDTIPPAALLAVPDSFLPPLPVPGADTLPPPGESAATPVVTPDTAAVPPPGAPARPSIPPPR
jgi:monofunctional glycosyltransferase